MTDPVKKARLWQGADAYPGVDHYRATTLSPGTRLEVGSPGLSGYTLPEGTAAAAGGDARTAWERAQVGPGSVNAAHPGYLLWEVEDSDHVFAGGRFHQPERGASICYLVEDTLENQVRAWTERNERD